MMICPCCNQVVAKRRTRPITEEEAVNGLETMMAMGWTRERLVASAASSRREWSHGCVVGSRQGHWRPTESCPS